MFPLGLSLLSTRGWGGGRGRSGRGHRPVAERRWGRGKVGVGLLEEVDLTGGGHPETVFKGN